MSDIVIIALIIAAVIVIALIIFRKQLSRFFFKAGPAGVEAEMETREPGSMASPSASQEPSSAAGERASVTISDNKQIGKQQKIDVGRPDVAVTDNLQLGEGQQITVRPDKTPPPPKP